jgi:hypothetical protein
MKASSNRRVSRNRKKSRTPLASLRSAEVVRAIVAHPRRLDELVSLIENPDRGIRGRAAANLARLAQSYPGRLVRVIERLKRDLADDSAYVRWNVAFALGAVGERMPARAVDFLPELCGQLEDENRVVRLLATQALIRIARQDPGAVAEQLGEAKRPVPKPLQPILASRSPK